MKYSIWPHRRRWPKIVVSITVILVLLIAGSIVAVRRQYYENLKPVSNNQKSVLFTIPMGLSLREIADRLKEEGLIRSDWAFERYVNSQNAREKLKAGTYALKPSQSAAEIVRILTEGHIAADLVTILPGKRIDEIRDSLINSGMDAAAVDLALRPALYANHPALVDKPKAASLEGYLYPESFQKTTETAPEEIIKASLDQMQLHLTPEVRASFVRHGFTVHQGVILASIVEREVGHANEQQDLQDKKQVAQVFLRRLREEIALESDATASYGAVLDNKPPSLTYASPYNTYLHKGLPPGPISNVGKNSLTAVASPANTDWLYFVSGDDGRTHFSKTLQEHERLTNEHCKRLCQ